MLNAIIRFSVRNKLIIGLCTLALLVLGVLELRKLPIDALPDITSNQVQVITVSPTLAAPEVERLVTFPIEQVTANIPGRKEMRSISRFGLSVVTIVYDDDTDIYWARQQVAERINQVREQIPATAGRPELAPVTTGLGEVYQYIIRPKKGYEGKYDLTELRSIQDWIVRRQLLGTEGVADVSSFGGFLKQYEVAIIPSRLKAMNVTLSDLFTALEKNNQNSGGAYIEKGPNALFIRTEGLATKIADIQKIVVKYTDGGIPVYVRDVAEVRIGHAIRYGAMTYSDKGEVAGAVVLMLKGANASEVVKNVEKRVAEIKKTLPEGVILDVFYNRTKMVDNAMSTVKKNLLEGALIVIIVLVLFLGNLRAGLIVASVIPLAMLFAIIGMNIFGVTGNLMSLGALDFGLIVDGAVIIVEAVLHQIMIASVQKRLTAGEMDREVQQSASRMMNAAVFGQVIILIVYLPILTLTGIEGKMFRPMAQTVSFALIGAFILSLTYVPMMSALLLGKNISHKKTLADRLMDFLNRIYRKLLQASLLRPAAVLLSAGIALLFSLFLASRLGGEFIPELQEGDFAVDARIRTGSSLTETIETTQKAVRILEERFPEIEKVVTRVGASEIPTDPMPLEMTDIIISLKPLDQWKSASSFDELADTMSRALTNIPGLTAGFQFPVQMRFNELISGARQDIVCKIFGENLDSLALYAQKLGNVIHNVKGATDLYVEAVTGLPQIVVEFNRDALAIHKLTVEEVNRVIRASFAGEVAGTVYENERRYDLVVRLDNQLRQDIQDVQQLLIPTQTGLQIPLYQLASVEVSEGPNQIQREDARRRIIVGFNVRGRDVESVVNELDERVRKEIKFPAGYAVQYGGQFENLVEARDRLMIAVPAALLLILTLLYFAFGSIRFGLLIFSAIPLSAIGGVLALWIRGMPFSISAGVGFIALFGVAVLNGIVLITEFNRIRAIKKSEPVKDVIMEGTYMRLRPVLMTAAVASLGFLPMALSHGPGAEVQRPLATVVIGGLITATFLTLVVLPVLYQWMESPRKKRNRKRAAPLALMLFVLFNVNDLVAQQPRTLAELFAASDSANLQLKAWRTEEKYWAELSSASFDPGATQVTAEYGQINSVKNDNRFFINQSFSLPTVYRRQQALQKAGYELQKRFTVWKKLDIEKELALAYYQLVDLSERRKILHRLDSIYRRFSDAAALRLKSGETNTLEASSAEMALQQLLLQQQALEADYKIVQQKLQWLTQRNERIEPLYQSAKKSGSVVDEMPGDSSAHPQMDWFRMQEEQSRRSTDIERSKLLPNFSIGYSNQSIIGFQKTDATNETYFGPSRRFSVVSLSMGIPIFNKVTRSRIRAAQAKEDVARLETAAATASLQNQRWQAQEEFGKWKQQVQFHEVSGQQRARLLMYHADEAFRAGEINYLEWSVLVGQSAQLQLNYADALAGYNRSLIELEYLNGKILP
ncbi:MAG: CusA/CzcA family heavy metal efflux RND transporter [Chitinophagaceae bacterium]